MSDDVSAPEEEPGPSTPARYGFGGALADGWEIFTKHLSSCLSLFAGLHLAGALFSFTLLLAASPLGDFAVIPARLTAGVVIPVIVGSLAIAAFSRRVLSAQPDPSEVDAPEDRGLLHSNVMGLTLVASLAAVAAVVFLGGYGILVLPFFYGPPIAMQLAITRDLSPSEALQTARASLAGRWYTLLYLFATALALGIISIVPVGGLVGLANGRDDLATIAALSLGRGLSIGLFASFLGAMQIAIFRRLHEEAPTASTREAATQG